MVRLSHYAYTAPLLILAKLDSACDSRRGALLILAALLAVVLALSCALSCALRHLEAGAEATEDGRASPAVSTRIKAVGLLSDKRITRVPNRSPEFAALPCLLFSAYTKTRCFAVCCSERCSPPTRRSLA